jgi:hypothetical protein
MSKDLNEALIIEIVLERVKIAQAPRTLNEGKLAEYRCVLRDIASGVFRDEKGTYTLKYEYLQRFYDEVTRSAK